MKTVKDTIDRSREDIDFILSRVITAIANAKKAAELKNACFKDIGPSVGRRKLPESEDEVTDFIRNRVELHHNSWIIKPLEDALNMLGYRVED